jgi:hypothetical protein
VVQSIAVLLVILTIQSELQIQMLIHQHLQVPAAILVPKERVCLHQDLYLNLLTFLLTENILDLCLEAVYCHYV